MNSIAGILQPWKAQAATFLAWWRDELWGLVPAALRAGVAGRTVRLILAPSPSGTRVFEDAGDGARPAGAIALHSQAEAAAEVARLAAANPAASIGVRIPVQSCFKRSVELPLAARNDAARILDLDLERSTPFKLKDVYTASYIDAAPAGPGKIRAIQLVAKRGAIDPVLQDLRARALSAAFVDCWADDGQTALPVNFLAVREDAKGQLTGMFTAPSALAALAALLLVSAIGIGLSRQQAALDEVQARVAETRTRAAAVRKALDSSDAAVAELTRLQRMKLAQIPAVEVLDELTRLLPDTVWITELRLQGDALDISGLARSGAALLPLFERSKLFAEASMTAALTFDQQEAKERFSLRVRVRQLGGEPRAATEANQ